MLTLTPDCSRYTYFLHVWWEKFVLNVAMKIPLCDCPHCPCIIMMRSISVFPRVLQMLPSVWYDYLCTHVSGLSVSGKRWILVSLIIIFLYQCSIKTYLLELYSYRKYFVLISLKERKKKIIVVHVTVWLRCARSCLCLFYLIQPEGKVCSCICLHPDLKPTMCLKLNFNPTPYVLMPRWRVWFVPVVQRKFLFIRVPVTTFC